MAGRHLVLWIGAALVLGVGVYLLVQVRAMPAPAAPPTVASRAAAPAPEAAPAAPPPSAAAGSAPPDAIPVAPPVPGLEAAGSDDGDGAGSAPPAFGLSDDKLQAVMADANKAYDRGDYEEARTIAGRVLIRQPSNARMLRILVSSSCIEGDAVAAQASMAMLPPADQERMRIRCQRYGITLTVPSAAAAK